MNHQIFDSPSPYQNYGIEDPVLTAKISRRCDERLKKLRIQDTTSITRGKGMICLRCPDSDKRIPTTCLRQEVGNGEYPILLRCVCVNKSNLHVFRNFGPKSPEMRI